MPAKKNNNNNNKTRKSLRKEISWIMIYYLNFNDILRQLRETVRGFLYLSEYSTEMGNLDDLSFFLCNVVHVLAN